MAFFLRKLRGAELNWSTHEKEALAQVLSLKEWRCYVEGVHFILETDHSPLRYLQTQPHLSRKQARWLEFFQQFSFEVRYKKGAQNRVADVLSRLQINQIEARWESQPGWISEIKAALVADIEAREARQAIQQGSETWVEQDELFFFQTAAVCAKRSTHPSSVVTGST